MQKIYFDIIIIVNLTTVHSMYIAWNAMASCLLTRFHNDSDRRGAAARHVARPAGIYSTLITLDSRESEGRVCLHGDDGDARIGQIQNRHIPKPGDIGSRHRHVVTGEE